MYIYRNGDALLNAIQNNNIKIVKLLIESGLNDNNIIGHALSIASKNGSMEIAEYLIKKRADVHFEDDAPLMNAIKSGNLPMVKLLVKKGANIHARNNFPLQSAVSLGNISIVKYLLKKGANLTKKHLIIACRINKLEMVEYIVSNGVNPENLTREELEQIYNVAGAGIVQYLNTHGATFQ